MFIVLRLCTLNNGCPFFIKKVKVFCISVVDCEHKKYASEYY